MASSTLFLPLQIDISPPNGSSNTSMTDSDEFVIDEETLLFLHDNNMQMWWANVFSIPTVVCGVLMSCVAMAGIIGNVFNVCIFSKRTMGNGSIGVLLTGLSAVDALLLLVAAPLFASSAIYVYRPSFRLMTFITYMTVYAYPFASTLQTASVWLMMVATMERWLGVCQPFVARTMCTRARAKVTVLVVLVLSLAYNGSRFWEYGEYELGGVMMILPRLRQNWQYIRIYVNWMYFVFIFAIPFGVLSVVNGMVVLTIQKAKRDRRHLTRQQRKEHATAALMVIVAFAYITCNSLAFVINAMELWGASGMHDVELLSSSDDLAPAANSTSDSISADLFSNASFQAESMVRQVSILNSSDPTVVSDDLTSRTTKRHSNFFYFLIDLNNLLVMCHCSLNFLIYYKFSQRFRAHVQMYVFGKSPKGHATIVDADGFESRNNSRRDSRPNGVGGDDYRDRSLRMLLSSDGGGGSIGANGQRKRVLCRNGTCSLDDSPTSVPCSPPFPSALHHRKHSIVDRQSSLRCFVNGEPQSRV